MKILILTNFYPPYQIGGYEMLCQEIVEALSDRGHNIHILTSTHGVNSPTVDGNIHRVLNLESNLDYYRISQAWFYPSARKKNISYFNEAVDSIQPDLVFIWGMWSLSKILAMQAEKRFGNRVIYYLANPWPIEPNMHCAYWDAPARKPWTRLAKIALRIPARKILKTEWEPVALEFLHAPCCSLALREQLQDSGIQLKDSPIIYEGINLSSYLEFADHRSIFEREEGGIRLTYVGILAPHKGVHTIINAIAKLPLKYQRKIKLTILGTGHPQYKILLHELVDKNDLRPYIQFKEPIPRVELPEYLSHYDVLLLPSTWEEPLARIMQEGLASGMVVVGSKTGGTKETIIDGKNGLLFEPENVYELKHQIEKLILDPKLFQDLGENGKKTAMEKFDMVRMVDDVETYLMRVYETPFSN